MGLPEQKRIFVHLIICLTLQIGNDIISARIACLKRNVNAVLLQLAKRIWLVIMAASCRAVLYFHGSRLASSICFRFYVILEYLTADKSLSIFSSSPIVSRAELRNLKEISWVLIILFFYLWEQRVWFSWKSTVHSISRLHRHMKYDWLGLGRIWLAAAEYSTESDRHTRWVINPLDGGRCKLSKVVKHVLCAHVVHSVNMHCIQTHPWRLILSFWLAQTQSTFNQSTEACWWRTNRYTSSDSWH